MSEISQPAIDTHIARHTAEMLALPHLVCSRRNCRRGNACRWYFTASGEPCCLRNLTPPERALFDTFYREALRTRDYGIWGSTLCAARDPEQRALQDAGVEIARNAVHIEMKKNFDSYRRKWDALAPATSIPAPLPSRPVLP